MIRPDGGSTPLPGVESRREVIEEARLATRPNAQWVIYLAGPEVFLPNAEEIGEAKLDICRRYGLDAVYPKFDLSRSTRAERGHEVFERCIDMMENCDAVVANMTPFRGVSMDVGTAVEIGYMLARQRRVLGYTNVIADYETRVADDLLAIDSFGFADNPMCEGPVWKSGGFVVRTQVDTVNLYTDLRGFVRCVEQASHLSGANS
jgi:nucleoside 2-deoxyribosyltransferase